MEYIFCASSAEWSRNSAAAHRYRGLAVYAVDGTTMRFPDTPEDWKAFGGQKGNGWLRAGTCQGRCASGPARWARCRSRELWNDLPQDSLTLNQRKGFPKSVLLTSLLDCETYPRSELAALDHERWEIELGYDEIKTHMLAREEAIRSRTPTGVRQELWAIGLAGLHPATASGRPGMAVTDRHCG